MVVYNKSGSKQYSIDENKEITRGGEGRIIDIGGDSVVKIYHLNIKPLSEKKFIELSELKSNTFVKPEELVYDNKGNVVGFIMKKISSDFFPILSIYNKSFCNRVVIDNKIKEKIIERIIDALKFAHSKGIIIGDLNPYNILVNESGLVYFIDVDSYETPSFKHSGILLEDVRDFLYGGNVNVNSDYFALAIMAFNSFTYVHPYKGVCKTMPNIADRMIRMESILKNNPNIIIPKCYEPITNISLNAQFTNIFNDGHRNVIDLNFKQQTINPVNVKPKVNIITKTNELIIHNQYLGDVVTTFASKDRFVILTKNGELLIYDVSLKGIFKQLFIKQNYTPKDRIFVYGNDVYCLRDNSLFNVITNDNIFTFKNTENRKIKTNQYDNILVVICDDTMFKFDLSIIFNGKMKYETTSVFEARFSNINGLHQNISGNSLVFYNKNDLNSVTLKTKIKDIYQSGNVSLIEVVENEKILYRFVTLKNLQSTQFDVNYKSLRYFDKLNENMIIVPEDNILSIIRIEDMQTVVNYDCDIVSETSTIHCTNGGIVVANVDSIYLVNKK